LAFFYGFRKIRQVLLRRQRGYHYLISGRARGKEFSGVLPERIVVQDPGMGKVLNSIS
jgi:hypothetical protein